MPIGVSDRDIVQKVTQQHHESEDMLYIIYKNATHPSRPEQPGVVRYVNSSNNVILFVYFINPLELKQSCLVPL